jgi:transposase InsO family protein
MKELGLNAAGPKPMLNSANDRQYKYYPNKLKGKFLTDAPNKIWVSDITYIKIEGCFVYLCVVIDLYSRKVIAYKVSKNIDTDLVKRTFLTAFESRGHPKDLTFHSDYAEFGIIVTGAPITDQKLSASALMITMWCNPTQSRIHPLIMR